MNDQIAWPAADRRDRIASLARSIIRQAEVVLEDLPGTTDDRLVAFANVFGWGLEIAARSLPRDTPLPEDDRQPVDFIIVDGELQRPVTL